VAAAQEWAVVDQDEALAGQAEDQDAVVAVAEREEAGVEAEAALRKPHNQLRLLTLNWTLTLPKWKRVK
jgi:hypothetical protein